MRTAPLLAGDAGDNSAGINVSSRRGSRSGKKKVSGLREVLKEPEIQDFNRARPACMNRNFYPSFSGSVKTGMNLVSSHRNYENR